MSVSVIIRTFNEERRLGELLTALAAQESRDLEHEVILVDSGSTDRTLHIANEHGCRILHIDKDEFTFGRALNMGCEQAGGDFLAIISGHCIPIGQQWLENLIAPLQKGLVSYTYGRQRGNQDSKFSEHQLFLKYFPDKEAIPQAGFFCNNANAALKKTVWEVYRFDETLPGLEDMELGKRLLAEGHRLGYVADAGVYHIHEESWHKVRMRYEREAVALQKIMPDVHVGFPDFLRYFFSGVFLDMSVALQERRLHREIFEICMFRAMQYWGAYRGNHRTRELSRRRKEAYFYPR